MVSAVGSCRGGQVFFDLPRAGSANQPDSLTGERHTDLSTLGFFLWHGRFHKETKTWKKTVKSEYARFDEEWASWKSVTGQRVCKCRGCSFLLGVGRTPRTWEFYDLFQGTAAGGRSEWSCFCCFLTLLWLKVFSMPGCHALGIACPEPCQRSVPSTCAACGWWFSVRGERRDYRRRHPRGAHFGGYCQRLAKLSLFMFNSSQTVRDGSHHCARETGVVRP